MSETNEQPVPAPVMLPEKKRFEWIDNARIVAAFLIMYHHLFMHVNIPGKFGSEYLHNLVLGVPFSARVPFFLVLAGYFLARRVTWAKAFDRFIWLLIPFVIWNAIYCYLVLGHPFTLQGMLPHLLGINYVVDSSFFSLFGHAVQGRPDISPSWFLRDIMFLSLLTPIIVKFRKLLPPLLVLATSALVLNCKINSGAMFAPATLYFYCLGVCLSEMKISDAYRILNPAFTKYYVVGLLGALGLITAMTYMGVGTPDVLGRGFATTFGMLFGTLLIAYTGVLIETHLPRLSKRMAPCGPACFLVFMLHEPVYHYAYMVIPPALQNSMLILLLPFVSFVFIVTFFLSMKHFTPFLMPYLGHMKVQAAKGTSK